MVQNVISGYSAYAVLRDIFLVLREGVKKCCLLQFGVKRNVRIQLNLKVLRRLLIRGSLVQVQEGER